MNKVIYVLSLGLLFLLFVGANDRLKCCICQRHASKFSDKRKFKSSVKYEEYFGPAFGLRPNEKRDSMICIGCVRAVYKWRKSGKPMNQVGTPFLHAVWSMNQVQVGTPFIDAVWSISSQSIYDPFQAFAITWVSRLI